MNSKTLLILAAVLGVVVVGFLLFRGAEAPVDESEETTEEMSHTVVLSEQNASRQSGTAVLVDLGNGATRVTIDAHREEDVENPLNDPQPAHIHSGTCEELGGVEYPLENVVDGHSETVVNVSLDALMAGTFAINIHQSAELSQIYTACGNI